MANPPLISLPDINNIPFSNILPLLFSPGVIPQKLWKNWRTVARPAGLGVLSKL